MEKKNFEKNRVALTVVRGVYIQLILGSKKILSHLHNVACKSKKWHGIYAYIVYTNIVLTRFIYNREHFFPNSFGLVFVLISIAKQI